MQLSKQISKSTSESFTHDQVLAKIKASILSLDLDLRGITVLTEAANGGYYVTPIIAALAGADVYAFARESAYGSVQEIFEFYRQNVRGLDQLSIHIIGELTQDIISRADIVTNSGHLRPLNKQKLQYLKKGAVISLMYEQWEFRPRDLDIEYCRLNDIPVGSTNERHPDVGVFDYLGDMALHLIDRAGLTIEDKTFILVCNNGFGPYIADKLSHSCGRLGVIDKPENKSNYLNRTQWLSDFPRFDIPKNYQDCEAIIFTAYPFDNIWIGNNTVIDIEKIISSCRNPKILRFAGDIDQDVLETRGIEYFPKDVQRGHMGVLPSDVGIDPIIKLQAGGLKVGEALLSKKYIHGGEVICEVFE